ncbi:MAG: hypothetical protein LBS05_05310 [Tannerellaceae bacterium]|nr:hypothetical protein [Tannerellaceae bacterium]
MLLLCKLLSGGELFTKGFLKDAGGIRKCRFLLRKQGEGKGESDFFY